ncbi:MAG: adenylate/guanylate cyclase domain-containing protein [Pseudomonadota bacterium]
MSEAPILQRKLTTILAADAANFSGRMAADEAGTVQALRASRAVIDARITARGGRIANTAGDGLIAEFPSVVEAVAAAVTIQQALRAEAGHLPFRIGVHLGDVIVEGSDLLGDGVNLAARLQEMAPEGGVLVSRQVVDQARGRLAAEFRPLSPTAPKHMPEEVELYGVLADGIAAPGDLSAVLPRNPAGGPAQNGYKRLRTRLFGVIGGLVVLDLMLGPGPQWYILLTIAILLGVTWRKPRAPQ